mgnify:CR=1 FL=1
MVQQLKAVIGFLALDALFYFQHRVSHAVPVLWRLHRVHHADTEMDVSTANRVHPFETLWITFLRVSLAVLLGIPIPVFIAFLVASLSLVGLPPMAGMWSKFLLVTAAFGS